MLRKRSRYTAMCLCLCIGLAASYSVGESDSRLLEFVLTANEQSVKKIESISYKFSYDIYQDSSPSLQEVPGLGGRRPAPTPGRTGPARTKGKSEVIQQGDSRWSSNQQNMVWVDSGAKQDFSSRATINDDYAAHWPVGNPYAYRDDHASATSISPSVREKLKLLGAMDLLSRASGGYEGGGLREVYDRTRERARWEVREVSSDDGGKLFRVERYRLPDSGASKPYVVQLIDPEKGFLITRTTVYFRSGAVKKQRDNVLAEVAKGIWAPTQVEEKVYYDAGQGSKVSAKIKRSESFDISDVEVNEEIDESAFALKSLGIDEGVVLIRRTLEGELVQLVHVDGKFIPLDLYRASQEALRELEAEVTKSVEEVPASAADSNAAAGSAGILPKAAEPPSGGVEDEASPAGNSRTLLLAWIVGAIVVVGLTAAVILLAAAGRSKRKKGGPMAR